MCVRLAVLSFRAALSRWYSTVRTASETASVAAVRMTFPNLSKLVAGAYWSLQQVPTIEDSTLRATVNLSFVADPTRYAT